jgi:hypothetical protein
VSPVTINVPKKYGVPLQTDTKVTDIVFDGNVSRGSHADTCRRTGGHDEADASSCICARELILFIALGASEMNVN